MHRAAPRLVAALVSALAATAAPASPAPGAPLTLKLATLAPTGSAWHELLRELGQRWEEASGGQVKLKVYAGGTQGNEGEVIRKMGINQLQAAAISNVGLHDLVAEAAGLTVPLMFKDEAEMECAFERIRPALEAAILARGYVVVQWSRIGSVSFYCDAPRATPEAMRGAKVFVPQGDAAVAEALRLADLRPVMLAATDLVPALQTGMVECVNNVALYALATRTFVKAPYVIDLPWGFMVGATLVRADAWQKVPGELRPRLLAAAQEVAVKVNAEVRRLNLEAVAAMQRQGLKLVPADPEAWRPVMERTWGIFRGGVVPAPFFDQVRAARDACRAAGPGRRP
jgi:TRAP-type C4-dicarboxylate transport system substrate-binding protein